MLVFALLHLLLRPIPPRRIGAALRVIAHPWTELNVQTVVPEFRENSIGTSCHLTFESSQIEQSNKKGWCVWRQHAGRYMKIHSTPQAFLCKVQSENR